MNALFTEVDMYTFSQRAEHALAMAVDRLDDAALLTAPEDEVVAYFVQGALWNELVIRDQEASVEEPQEISISVTTGPTIPSLRTVEMPGTRVVMKVPYEGDSRFFRVRPTTHNLNPPALKCDSAHVIFSYEVRDGSDGDELRRRFQSDLGNMMHWVDNLRNDCRGWNERLPTLVESLVTSRKARLGRTAALVESLGIPMTRRNDAENFSVPVVRKKIPLEPPQAPPSRPISEPFLDAQHYEAALQALVNARNAIERSPSMSMKLDEEETRDILLVFLNGQFEGQAGGELFNAYGRTDICIRVEDRNVFIAECKIWDGPEKFKDAINQLLRYLVWRDTKAALLLFIRHKGASSVIEKAVNALANHPNCREVLDAAAPDERQDFLFAPDSDQTQRIRLAFMPFVLTPR